jgi:MFS family permease
MPALAFATSFLWVMVMGILGPCLPAMMSDLGIGYAQAGFLFTLLSLGSLIGTSLGAIGSDYLPRKLLYGTCVLALSLGLLALGFMTGYVLIALVLFLLSAMGSPIGAIGQSIMLDMFPGKRERYLSFMALFGALGSLLSPIIVGLNFTASLSWRWTFREASILVLMVFLGLLALRLPDRSRPAGRASLLTILRHRGVLSSAALIFLSVAPDLGFSYWLAQHFSSELHQSMRLSSSVIGIYLVGVIAGRLLVPSFLKRVSPRGILVGGICLALASILSFILAPLVPVKIALAALYGFGIGPLFPLIVAKGTREFPAQAGAVTGLLYGSLSLGGMAFPLLVGALAARWGINHAYLFCAAVLVLLLGAMLKEGREGLRGRLPVKSPAQALRGGDEQGDEGQEEEGQDAHRGRRGGEAEGRGQEG